MKVEMEPNNTNTNTVKDRIDPMNILRIPLVVDGAMVFSIVVGGTVMWQQQRGLSENQKIMSTQIQQIQQAIESDRNTFSLGRTGSTERLARIEERLIILQEQVVDVRQELRVRSNGH